ncbi:methyl-accepting chemotaxis protein [Burkholderia glumae]|uniref:methyl-accepting chemotaxis protein n=1 Tax=Burkholderia glumae TaxID=337 RepID=UPI0014632C63|nr:methyl-accepting chemotaxis protein [Burkholderia glumae]QJP70744.1 hypothetical protein HJC54_11085 [Burkholderia glumae]
MNNFMQSIKFKILASMVFWFFLMLVISIFGISAIFEMRKNVRESYTEVTVPIQDLAEIRATQLDIRLQFRRIQAFREPQKTQTAVDAVKLDLATMKKAWADYYPLHVSSPQEKSVADAIDAGLPDFQKLTEHITDLFASGNYDGAAEMVDQHANASTELLKIIAQDILINDDQAKDYARTSDEEANFVARVAIALLAAGVLVIIAACVYLFRAIGRPLDEAIHLANHIAGGQLENTIRADASGEFGDLLRALSAMDANLTKMVRGIQSSANSVTLAASEIASGNIDLSARTEQQAASLEETAASMTQITQTVKQNAENAKQANALAASATGLADSGDASVHAMIGEISRISDSSAKISEITGMIESIAFQTNILALNAAVEAARAGEEGRGFAVVASEVRNLAQRSAAAAKEIKALISSSVEMIHQGSKQAGEVGTTMAKVRIAIKRVSDIVNEMAAASEEQSRGIEQVNQAVSQMDAVTQQNAALVEQAAASAQSLDQQAASLRQAASEFHLASSR